MHIAYSTSVLTQVLNTLNMKEGSRSLHFAQNVGANNKMSKSKTKIIFLICLRHWEDRRVVED